MGSQIPIDVLVLSGLLVLVIVFSFAAFAKLYRKAGPHEALVVYGFRGMRIIKGKGTVIYSDDRKRARAFAGADVVRCGSEAGPVHQAGRCGDGRGGGADQGEVG